MSRTKVETSKLKSILFRPLVSRKIFLLFVVSVVAVVIIANVTFRLIPILRSEKFTGVITGEYINCMMPDGGTHIIVEGREITLEPSFGSHVSLGGYVVGSVDKKLYTCKDFDYTTVKTGMFGIPLPGQPDGGEDLLGARVEVYAQKTGPKEYTIEGSNWFYVKLIE